MKRILGIVLVFIFSFMISGNVFGGENIEKYYSIIIENKSLFSEHLILSKKELEKTYKGKIDINKIDKLIPLIGDKTLINFYDKLSIIDSNSNKLEKHKYLLRYLYAKIGLEIHNRKNIIRGTTDNYNNFYEDSTSITRDIDRVDNIRNLSLAAEMAYMDDGVYPSDLEELKNSYLLHIGSTFPIDLMDGKTNNECTFGYKYEVFNNEYGINQGYTITTCLENKKDGSFIFKKGTE